MTFSAAAGDRAEGAEGDLDNSPATNNMNRSSSSSSATSTTSTTSKPAVKKTFSLEARFSFLNLRRPRPDNTKKTDSCSQKVESNMTSVVVIK